MLAHALKHDPIKKLLQQYGGSSVLELGSGTGAVGLSAAVVGGNDCNVVLSDRQQLLQLLQHNVALNRLDGRCNVCECDWDKVEDASLDALAQQHKFDIVLCSDVLYKVSLTRSFARVLKRLMEHPTGPRAAFMAHELRQESPECFKELAHCGIVYGRLPHDACDPQWRADDIAIFFLRPEKPEHSE